MSETPGEGTGPTEAGIPVGRVPPPGESGSSKIRVFTIPKHGIRKSESMFALAGLEPGDAAEEGHATIYNLNILRFTRPGVWTRIRQGRR